ncbi:SDR family NAD(P)-dependent oxidoreductase, partial [Streptomyces sp. NPDC005955]|uniref:type I polyketide synthase n=1 Tax=Streptomyces sp. NPDC005955 TaxID=3364738 RepID=UPI0036A700D7
MSSFGISGTNAHVILEEPPEFSDSETVTGGVDQAAGSPAPILRDPQTASGLPGVRPAGTGTGTGTGTGERSSVGDEVTGPPMALPLVLSAKTPTALRTQARRLSDFLSGGAEPGPAHDGPVDPSAVAYTAACIQSGFDHRAAVLPDADGDYRGALDALAAGMPDALLTTGIASGRARAAFVFGAGTRTGGTGTAGGGPDSAAAARELLAASPAFAAYVRECAAALATHLGRNVAELTPADPPEAVAFVVGVGLARLWERCGVRPDATLGQGVGEIVAAHVAGALTLDEAARLCAAHVRGGSDEELRAATAGVPPRRTKTDLCSSRTGRPLDAARELTAEHWLHALREPADLDAALRHLAEDGRRTLVGMPAAPLLVATPHDRAAGHPDALDRPRTPDHPGAPGRAEAVDHPRPLDALRPGAAGAAGILLALSTAYAHGLPVDWQAVIPRRPLTVLPTYPFERRRYWLNADAPRPPHSGEHALLDTAVTLADRDAQALTGTLSTLTHPWLADHRIDGHTVLPGTALVELAAHIAALDGAATVTELTQEAPVRLPDDGRTVEVQFVVGAVGETGERPFTVYARPGRARQAARAADWTRHATGILAPRAPRTPTDFDQAAWPPPGAEPVELSNLYAELAEAGYAYGPAFQGLEAAWRLGDDLCLDVRLPLGTDTSGYGLHPALLDAALHATVWRAASDGRVRLPFSWSGVRLYGGDATELRVRVSPVGPDAVALRITDRHGTPMAAVDSLVLRAAPGGPADDGLLHVTWTPLADDTVPEPAPDVDADACWVLGSAPRSGLIAVLDVAEAGARLDAGAPPPAAVLVPCLPSAVAGGEAHVPDAVRRAARRALTLLQSWLDDDRFADTRLVFVTRRAVRTGAGADGTPVDLAHAPLWGLVRTARSEHPDRFVLLDLDGDLDETRLTREVLTAVATGGAPELALRDGALFAPRLSPVPVPASVPVPAPVSRPDGTPGPGEAAAPTVGPHGTVLVTGGTGALGARIARHLVAHHGVRHLLLTSRSGPRAAGADELARELRGRGVQVRIAACDCADREALSALLEAVPADHPLTGVVHAAGVVQDATVRALTFEQLDAVLGPKAEAAWNLHELTRAAPLAFFDLFSSATGTLGAAGQGNYTLANTFLDALARHRADLGLPGRSLAWGLWDLPDGMAGRLTAHDVERLGRRTGLRPLDAARGLRMYDAARALDLPTVVAAALDPAFVPAFQPATASATAPTAATAADRTGTPWSRRLAELPEGERTAESRRLVMSIAGEVLGGSGIDGGLAFRDAGFDSLLAVELRNRLCEVTGLRLPPTVVFDHPTPLALSAFLGRLFADPPSETPSTATIPAVSPARTTNGNAAPADDPVVIVGMACRFPGGVVSPEGLWDVVVSGG